MELCQLQYFCEVVRCGKISKAAKNLAITQSILTRAIKKLEEELGVDLLEHEGQLICPTTSGEYFYQVVSKLLDMLTSSVKALQSNDKLKYKENCDNEIHMDFIDKQLYAELEMKFMQGIASKNLSLLEMTMERFMDLEIRTMGRYQSLFKDHVVSRVEQILVAFSIPLADYVTEQAEIVHQFRKMRSMTSMQEIREQCLRVISILREYIEEKQDAHLSKVGIIIRFIQNHYDDPCICADMIGDAVGLGPTYLGRLLRQNTGMGVVDYIHAARLKKAKELLATTSLNLDDIAVQVGFSNHWALSRSFKRYENTTPSAYRECIRNAFKNV